MSKMGRTNPDFSPCWDALRQLPEGRGFTGCRRTRRGCHSEEPQAVLSIAKEESRIVHENTQSEILRCAQDDSVEAFFRDLFSPAPLADFTIHCIADGRGGGPFANLRNLFFRMVPGKQLLLEFVPLLATGRKQRKVFYFRRVGLKVVQFVEVTHVVGILVMALTNHGTRVSGFQSRFREYCTVNLNSRFMQEARDARSLSEIDFGSRQIKSQDFLGGGLG